jgi:putative redox protein
MDVYAHLNKRKQLPTSLRLEADATVREKSPAIFTQVVLDYYLEGPLEESLAVEAVRLSQTKYCGVSAMIAKACPIRYRIHLNGARIGEGQAEFLE